MRLSLCGSLPFLAALAVAQSHPNVRRRDQEGGFSPGHAYGTDFPSTVSNPYSTVAPHDTDSSFGQSGEKLLGNGGTINIPKYSAPETIQLQDPNVLNAATKATTAEPVELSYNQAETTGQSNQADTTGQSNQGGTSGQSNQADTTGEGNQAAMQTNNPNDQGDTGTSAQTQDTSTFASPAETNQGGTEGNPAETNQNDMEGEPAQVPAPAPTESNAAPAYQQGYQQATPATSPYQDADDFKAATLSPSVAVVMAAPTPAPRKRTSRPTEDYYNSNEVPSSSTPQGNSYGDPWGNPVEGKNTEPYEPPDDDPVEEGMEGENDWEDKTTVQIAEEDLDEALHDKYVPIVAALCGVIAFFFMIFVAQQMIENPDGCCAKICRCSVACFRILCCPCRTICCCGSRAKARRTHELVMNDNGSYGNGNYGYTHDLELT